jgi:hypothetical protein
MISATLGIPWMSGFPKLVSFVPCQRLRSPIVPKWNTGESSFTIMRGVVKNGSSTLVFIPDKFGGQLVSRWIENASLLAGRTGCRWYHFIVPKVMKMLQYSRNDSPSASLTHYMRYIATVLASSRVTVSRYRLSRVFVMFKVHTISVHRSLRRIEIGNATVCIKAWLVKVPETH